MHTFATVADVETRFRESRYLPAPETATVVFLASRMEKPILVEGPAGVGKTELAKVLAQTTDRELIRLQCYEGLDEAKALYEWQYAKQLLYTQILRDKIGEALASTRSLEDAVRAIAGQDDAFFSREFLLARPLLKALTAERPTVLLIDEVDKSDQEFEAFLLEILSDFQVSIPELGTIAARHRPLVVLTSNNAREMSDALKRRCLHLYVDFPNEEMELAIVRLKVPELKESLARQLVAAVQRIRKLDLKKHPSIAETLDWGRALVLLNAETLDRDLVLATLNVAVKHEADIAQVRMHLREIAR